MPRAAKEIVDVRSLARSHTASMVNVLRGIAQQPDAPAAARVTAAGLLLDRGWGKPDQAHVGADGGDIQIIIRQIVDSPNAVNGLLETHDIIDVSPSSSDDP